MADEITNPPPEPVAAPIEAPREPQPLAERTFTQAEVDAFVAREKRKWKGPAKTQDSPPEDVTSQIAAVREELAKERRDRIFSEALSRLDIAPHLNEEQREVLRDRFKPDAPEEMAAFAAKIFAGVKPHHQAPAAPSTSAPPAPFTIGAPSPAPRAEAVNPVSWTQADIAQLRARGEFLPKLEEWRASLPGGSSIFRRRVPKGT